MPTSSILAAQPAAGQRQRPGSDRAASSMKHLLTNSTAQHDLISVRPAPLTCTAAPRHAPHMPPCTPVTMQAASAQIARTPAKQHSITALHPLHSHSASSTSLEHHAIPSIQTHSCQRAAAMHIPLHTSTAMHRGTTAEYRARGNAGKQVLPRPKT